MKICKNSTSAPQDTARTAGAPAATQHLKSLFYKELRVGRDLRCASASGHTGRDESPGGRTEDRWRKTGPLPATDYRLLLLQAAGPTSNSTLPLMAGSLGQKDKGSPTRDDSIETRKTRVSREWEMCRSESRFPLTPVSSRLTACQGIITNARCDPATPGSCARPDRGMGVPPMLIGGTPMPQGLTDKMSVSLLARPLTRTDSSESV